jgi:hypothetical protein
MARERIQQKSTKNTKHRSQALKRCFLWLAVALVLFFGFGLLARIASIQVKGGDFENIVVTNTNEIQDVVDEYLDARFFYPRSNIVWFSERKLERRIKNEFPRLGRVDISIIPKRTIKVWGQEREGVHLWCGQEPQDVTVETSECYFADQSGFIFDRAPFFAGASFLRFYGGDFENSPIGSSLVDTSILDSYYDFESVLENYDFEIQAIWDGGDGQVEFILLSNNAISEAPRVKHFLGNDIEIVLGNVVSALGDNSVLLDIRENYDRLEYIDTRFTGQFIYKFFDVVSVQPVQEVVEQEYVEISEETIEEEPEIEVEESTEG